MATPRHEAWLRGELHSTTQLVTALQWTDIPSPVYLVAFARQYTWGFEDQAAAWTVSIVIGAALLYVDI
jgi:hypothetical protein